MDDAVEGEGEGEREIRLLGFWLVGGMGKPSSVDLFGFRNPARPKLVVRNGPKIDHRAVIHCSLSASCHCSQATSPLLLLDLLVPVCSYQRQKARDSCEETDAKHPPHR